MEDGEQTFSVSDIASAAGLDYNWCSSDDRQQHNHIPKKLLIERVHCGERLYFQTTTVSTALRWQRVVRNKSVYTVPRLMSDWIKRTRTGLSVWGRQDSVTASDRTTFCNSSSFKSLGLSGGNARSTTAGDTRCFSCVTVHNGTRAWPRADCDGKHMGPVCDAWYLVKRSHVSNRKQPLVIAEHFSLCLNAVLLVDVGLICPDKQGSHSYFKLFSNLYLYLLISVMKKALDFCHCSLLVIPKIFSHFLMLSGLIFFITVKQIWQ